MFCSSCGVEAIKESSFCKSCGAKLQVIGKVDQVQNQPVKMLQAIKFLSIVTGVVTLGGFLFIALLTFLLLNSNVKGREVEFMMFIVVLLTFGIPGLLIRQLSRMISAYLHSDRH